VGAEHLADDIVRHGPQDVYWVYKFEQEVKKNMEMARNTNNNLYNVTITFYQLRMLFM
jgi:hypothetical protein